MDVISFAWSRAVSLRVGTLKPAVISRVPFSDCRSGVIGLAIAVGHENDGHLSPWQEAGGQQVIRDGQERRLPGRLLSLATMPARRDRAGNEALDWTNQGFIHVLRNRTNKSGSAKQGHRR
jgi:hypothetical protein